MMEDKYSFLAGLWLVLWMGFGFIFFILGWKDPVEGMLIASAILATGFTLITRGLLK